MADCSQWVSPAKDLTGQALASFLITKGFVEKNRILNLFSAAALSTISAVASAQPPSDDGYGYVTEAPPAPAQVIPVVPIAPPPPPVYQQNYYYYPTYAPPRRYYYVPVAPCPVNCVKPVRKWDGVRRVSLGFHVSVLGINQHIDQDRVVLGGAGFQLRVRNKGHLGFEASQSFIHGSFRQGGYERTSFPLSLSFMAYLFPNEDSRHFNLYAAVGGGVMPDLVRVRFAPGDYRSQDFFEWEGHAGLGAELRFHWFAIEADARVVGLIRENDDRPAIYYAGVADGPIADKSWGLTGNVNVSFWF